MMNDLEIALGYRASDWKALSLENMNEPGAHDWSKAFKIFDKRIRVRFFDPIDALLELERGNAKKTFGFAVLAIDCLVIETLQGFIDGIENHNAQSKALFTKFLKNWKAFTVCVPPNDDATKRANEFYVDCRCALHHSGATGSTFRVRAVGPTFVFSSARVEVNRILLHSHLKQAFDQYLFDLSKPENSDLRRKFRTKMDYICRTFDTTD